MDQILQERSGDPEEILTYLGFASANQDGALGQRIPERFFRQPSKAQGISVHEFLGNNPDMRDFIHLQMAATQPMMDCTFPFDGEEPPAATSALDPGQCKQQSEPAVVLAELQSYLLSCNVPEHYLLHSYTAIFDELVKQVEAQGQGHSAIGDNQQLLEQDVCQQDPNNNVFALESTAAAVTVQQAVDELGSVTSALPSSVADRPDSLQLCNFGDEDGHLSWSTDTTITPDPVYYYQVILSPGETLVWWELYTRTDGTLAVGGVL